jgi:twinkle protein
LTSDDSEFSHKEPCPKCGSKDNLARYTDGHGFCFGCNHYEPGDNSIETNEAPRERKDLGLIAFGEPTAWASRGITLESAQKWGFTRSELSGQAVRLFNYRNAHGQPVAQKVRFQKKDFRFLGDTGEAGLYGMHLWKDGGKRVVITEGEIDAISVSQAQGHKWPVVSVPTGANGAYKALKKNLEWLNKFDEVVLMFDMDAPGQEAVTECYDLFVPGRCKVATLPLKDANAMLMAGQVKEIIDAIWQAKVVRPDGIVNGSEMFDLMNTEDDLVAMSLPFVGLQTMMRGVRLGELITVTAGSGIGKSAVVREIAHHLHALGETVGMMMLEENTKRTGLGLMGISANKPLHIDRSGITPEDFKAAFDATLGTGRIFLYDHFGSTAIENLLNKVRYLAKGCGCRFIVIDHLSIVISGQEDGDERRMIDNAMTALKSIAMECNVCIFLISHLKRPSGDKGHEQGAETTLAQLRGSHSIAQLSDFVIGLERDQQNVNTIRYNGKTYTINNITTLRILKNRFTGETGPAGWLLFDKATGRLFELMQDPLATEGDMGGSDFEEGGYEPPPEDDCPF